MVKNSHIVLPKNLIFLLYIYGEKLELTDEKPECVDIHSQDGTWIFKDVKYQIGSFRRSMVGCYCGIYGVYDCTNTAHLKAMICHAIDIAGNRESFWDK